MGFNSKDSPDNFTLVTVEAQHLKRGDAICGQRNNLFPRVIENPQTHGHITLVKFEGHSEAGPKDRKYQVVKFVTIPSETMHLF